jgi:hypothetical protein
MKFIKIVRELFVARQIILFYSCKVYLSDNELTGAIFFTIQPLPSLQLKNHSIDV